MGKSYAFKKYGDHTMGLVVVDKDWLIKIKMEDLNSFTNNHRFLIIAALGYEIVTAKESHLIGCRRRLKSIQKHLDIIDHVGSLLNYEIAQHNPCTPIENRVYDQDDRIIENFLSRISTGKEKIQIEDLHNAWEKEGVESFKMICSGVSYWLPELRKITAGSDERKIKSILEKVAINHSLIKQVYDKIRHDDYPPTEKINENWALYRWVQIHLMAGVEYVRKYGAGNIEAKSNGFSNDNIDIQYCIIGVLAGGIATDDGVIKRYFRLCCPNGLLLDLPRN